MINSTQQEQKDFTLMSNMYDEQVVREAAVSITGRKLSQLRAKINSIKRSVDRGLLQDARSLLTEAVRLSEGLPHPELVATTLQLAKSEGSIKSKDLLSQLKPLLSISPDSVYLLGLIATAQIDSKQYVDALQTIANAVRICPEGRTKDYLVHLQGRLGVYLGTQHRDAFAEPDNKRPHTGTVLMMIRDEDDIISHNLSHHYKLGFRNFFILLHKSRDKTSALINAFHGSHADIRLVVIKDESDGHFQAGKTKALFEFSKQYLTAIGINYDWFFPIDADEFIDVPSDVELDDVLRDLGNRSILFYQMCNAASAKSAPFEPESSVYTHFDIVSSFSARVVTKCAIRAPNDVTFSPGNHRAAIYGISPESIVPATDYGIRLIHLPIRSTEQLNRKFSNGANAVIASGVNSGRAWLKRNELLQKDELSAADTIMRTHLLSTRKGARNRLPQFRQ